MVKDTYFEINDKKYPARIGMISFMEFEELTGKTANDVLKGLSQKELIQFFQCSLDAGCRYNKIPFELTFEDVLIALEDHPEYLLTFNKMVLYSFGFTDKMLEEMKNIELDSLTGKK